VAQRVLDLEQPRRRQPAGEAPEQLAIERKEVVAEHVTATVETRLARVQRNRGRQRATLLDGGDPRDDRSAESLLDRLA
jgi:hypothetical protein